MVLIPVLDVCNIPVIVAYGGSEINYEVTINNVTSSGRIGSEGAEDMDYDPVSRRLFYYNSDNFYSMQQDGSDLKHLGEVKQVVRFTVDGRNNIIYYVHESTDTVYMFNMTSAENAEVSDLEDVAGVRDVDMDNKNG